MGTVSHCCTNESKLKLDKTRRENAFLKQQLVQTHRSCRDLTKKTSIKQKKKTNKSFNSKTKTKQKELQQNAPEPKPMPFIENEMSIFQQKGLDCMELAIFGYIRPFNTDIPMDIAYIIFAFYDCCNLLNTQHISPLDDIALLYYCLVYKNLNDSDLKRELSKFLATRTSSHRKQTADAYYQRYGTDLMDDISRSIKKGRFLELVDGLFRTATFTTYYMDDFVSNGTTKTMTENLDPTDERIPSLMDLNLFGQGPIINTPSMHSVNPIDTESGADVIKDIEEILIEMDEDENGYIDFSEFEEAIKIIDNTIIHGEIDAIYELMSGSNIPSFPGMVKSDNDNDEELEGKDLGELNIKLFIGYIEYKYNEHQENKETKCSERKRRLSLQCVLSESNSSNIHSLPQSVVDAKMIIRIAFPEIFNNDSSTSFQNLMGTTTTNLWGVKRLSSLDRLMEELKEEAPDNKTLDYAEFEAAMNNFGVQFEPNNLEILFSHFIDAQSVSITSKHLHKRKEVNIQFFTKYIGEKVRNHDVMDPKQILETAFGQLLLNGIKRQKGSHKNILNVKNNLAANDNMNSNELIITNPYFDSDLMNDVSKDFAPDKIKKYEINHSVKEINDIMSPSLNGRKNSKLLRAGSIVKWKGDELDDLESEMNMEFEKLVNQHITSKSQGKNIKNLVNTNSAKDVLKPIE